MKHTPWNYIGDEDGDFVIYEGEEFVANIGCVLQQVSENPAELVAFDVDQSHAKLICKAVNSHEGLLKDIEDLKHDIANALQTASQEADWATEAMKVRDDVVEALSRQCDNIAYILNHCDVKLVYGKFTKELEEDRKAIAKAEE